MPEEPRTTWVSGSIKDSRGRWVRQLDPVLLHLRREHSVIPPQPLESIAQGIGLGMTRANRVTLWAGVVGVACLVIGATILSIRLARGAIGVRQFVGSMVPLTAVWVTLVACWTGTRGVRFQRTKRVMLAHRYCPHCGYDLSGLAADPQDGATMCPECGSAWVMKREA